MKDGALLKVLGSWVWDDIYRCSDNSARSSVIGPRTTALGQRPSGNGPRVTVRIVYENPALGNRPSDNGPRVTVRIVYENPALGNRPSVHGINHHVRIAERNFSGSSASFDLP